MSKSWEHSPAVVLPNGAPVIGARAGAVIESLNRALVPDGGDIPVDLDDTRAFEFLAEYLRDLDPTARFGVKALLFIFDLFPFLFIGRFSRFVHLSSSEQELYLKDWEASRLYVRRLILVLLKTVVEMGYYKDPQVLEAIGYRPRCDQGGAS